MILFRKKQRKNTEESDLSEEGSEESESDSESESEDERSKKKKGKKGKRQNGPHDDDFEVRFMLTVWLRNR